MRELREQRLLLREDVGLDARVQPPPMGGGFEVQCPPVLRAGAALHQALLLQPVDHAAGSALVQVQLGRQLVERERLAQHHRLQGIALRDGDVVAADAVAVAELVDAHQLVQRVVQRRRVGFQPGVLARDGERLPLLRRRSRHRPAPSGCLLQRFAEGV